jgi:hypothetical protein
LGSGVANSDAPSGFCAGRLAGAGFDGPGAFGKSDAPVVAGLLAAGGAGLFVGGAALAAGAALAGEAAGAPATLPADPAAAFEAGPAAALAAAVPAAPGAGPAPALAAGPVVALAGGPAEAFATAPVFAAAPALFEPAVPGAALPEAAAALAGVVLTGPGPLPAPLAGPAFPAAGAFAAGPFAAGPFAAPAALPGAGLAAPAALPVADFAGAAGAFAFAAFPAAKAFGFAAALAGAGRPRAASTRPRLVSRAARTSSASAYSRRSTRLKRFSTSRSTRRTSATGAPGAEGSKTTVGSIRATVRASWEPPLLVRLQPLAWASLVIVAGPAAADALDSWSTAPRAVASVLLWALWGGVLLASLAPRPLGLTALRVAAPLAVVLALLAAPGGGPLEAALAVAGTGLACWLAFTPAVGYRFVNGAAYGEERRFPLRVPPALVLGPLPLAVLLIGAGVAAGPLLLADRRWVIGVLALAAGVPVVRAAGRSVYSLSQRWAVLVPAGIVLKDPLTLIDPVLFPRDRIASLRPLPFPAAPAEDVVDLRLGAVPGSLVLELTEEAQLFRARGRLRGGESVKARRIAFCPRQTERLLAEAAARKKPRGSVL